MLAICSLASPQEKYYFYQPNIKYGSELSFNPAVLIVNGGFDILRNGARTKKITELDYNDGFEHVIDNISDPVNRIKQYGVEEFLAHEIFPIKGYDINYFQYWPNYATHVIGNGMQYVKAAEWYDYHDFKRPYLLSALTTTFYQILNEVVEHGTGNGVNVDPIADILIFNPLGIGLFSFEFTQRFFSGTVQLVDWSLQPMFAPRTNFLENAGQQFALKYKLPFTSKISGFVFWGIQAMLGFSVDAKNETHYSIASGVVVNDLHERKIDRANFLAPNLDGAVGFFYDRKNSLLYSVILTGPRIINCRINIYPGFIRTKYVTPGIFCGFGEWDGLLIGISFAQIPFGIVNQFK
jgi:hypothetical protein